MAFGEEIPYQLENKDYSSSYKKELWETAFGLQQTDGLCPSQYMVKQAQKHIDGQLTYDEIEKNVQDYYRSASSQEESRTEEADLSSLRIAEILSEEGFSLSPVTLKSYHKRLFQGIASFRFPVGEYRKANLRKSEEVLAGESVEYAHFSTIADTLAYDFEREREKSYAGLSEKEIALKVMDFVSGLWQIHPFREGNTRTSAVFLIKYLRNMGFEINNEPFKLNSQFFRDALVMANTSTTSRFRTKKYMEEFMENLLFSGKHDLNRKRILEENEG